MATDDRYRVPLDADLIQVLASDTRRRVLRLLEDRRMTLSELARSLDLKKSTVLEHLRKLSDAGLVDRDEEEDRLWVYYDLSHRGRNILSPDRSRLYLAVGASVLAGIGAIVLFIGFQMILAPPSGHTLGVQVQEGGLDAGPAAAFHADVAGVDRPQEVDDAYLVPAGAPGPTERGRVVPGPDWIALQPRAAATGVTFVTEEPVPQGSYRLFVSTLGGRDNRQSMPTLQARPLGASLSASTYWRGLSEPVQVRLDGPGSAAGTVGLVANVSSPPVATAPVQEGRSRLSTGTLQEVADGTYRLRYTAEGRTGWTLLGPVLSVRTADVHVTPDRVLAGDLTRIRVSTDPPAAIDAADLRVDGDPAAPIESTPGVRAYGIHPEEPGSIHLGIGHGIERSLPVDPALQPTLVLQDGPRLHVDVQDADGRPVAGVAVRVDGAGHGFTDERGRVRIPMPDAGRHLLRLETAGGAAVERRLEVDGWNISVPSPRPQITVTPVSEGGETPRIHVRVANTGDADGVFDVRATRRGETVAARSVAVEAGRARSVVLPAGDDPRDAVVRVEARGAAAPEVAFRNRTTAHNRTTAPPPEPEPTDAADAVVQTDIRVQDLYAQILTSREGLQLRVVATARNLGTAGGERTVPVRFDDRVAANMTFRLDAGGQSTRSVLVGLDRARTVQVEVGGQAASIDPPVVGQASQEVLPIPALEALGVAAGLGAAALIGRRRR